MKNKRIRLLLKSISQSVKDNLKNYADKVFLEHEVYDFIIKHRELLLSAKKIISNSNALNYALVLKEDTTDHRAKFFGLLDRLDLMNADILQQNPVNFIFTSSKNYDKLITESILIKMKENSSRFISNDKDPRFNSFIELKPEYNFIIKTLMNSSIVQLNRNQIIQGLIDLENGKESILLNYVRLNNDDPSELKLDENFLIKHAEKFKIKDLNLNGKEIISIVEGFKRIKTKLDFKELTSKLEDSIFYELNDKTYATCFKGKIEDIFTMEDYIEIEDSDKCIYIFNSEELLKEIKL